MNHFGLITASPTDRLFQSRGLTGSLSSARTPKQHSCTRRSGSSRTNRSSASTPSANSREASERLEARLRRRSREVLRLCVLGPVDDAQVLASADLERGLREPAAAS